MEKCHITNQVHKQGLLCNQNGFFTWQHGSSKQDSLPPHIHLSDYVIDVHWGLVQERACYQGGSSRSASWGKREFKLLKSGWRSIWEAVYLLPPWNRRETCLGLEFSPWLPSLILSLSLALCLLVSDSLSVSVSRFLSHWLCAISLLSFSLSVLQSPSLCLSLLERKEVSFFTLFYWIQKTSEQKRFISIV